MMMVPRCASVERHGGVSQTISGPRAVHGKADVGCRLVQEGARSERKRCQGPEMRALREGVGVLPTVRVRGGRDKRGQAHHRFMVNNRSCTAGSVLVCGEPAQAPLAGTERRRTTAHLAARLSICAASRGRETCAKANPGYTGYG